MAFQQEGNRVIVDFGDIEIRLFVPGVSNTDGTQYGEIDIQLILDNGDIGLVTHDLLARLQDDSAGQAHAANLLAMRDYILTRIPLEVLP